MVKPCATELPARWAARARARLAPIKSGACPHLISAPHQFDYQRIAPTNQNLTGSWSNHLVRMSRFETTNPGEPDS